MYGIELKEDKTKQPNHPLAQRAQDPQSTCTKEDASKDISCVCLGKVNCYSL